MGTTKARTTATPRASAKFEVGFGLVSVPFALKPLADSGRPVSGKYVCPQHGPNIAQRYLCSEGTPQEHLLGQGEQTTAYEHPDKPGEYVVVEKDVLAEIAEERTGHVQVERIVDTASIDPAYFDKTYLCWSQPGGEDKYDLFTAVLRGEAKAAVCTVVLSKQTVMLVIRWSEELGTLVAHVCRFHSQIRWADVGLVKGAGEARPEPAKEALELAKQIFASLDGKFEAAEAVDRYTPLLEEAVRAAASGKTFTAPEPATAAAPTQDLLASLMASVEATKKPAAKAKAPAKARASRSKQKV